MPDHLVRAAHHAWANDVAPSISGPHLLDLEADLDALFARVSGSVAFDHVQTLTPTEVLQAILNIGAVAKVGTTAPATPNSSGIITIASLLAAIAAEDARILPAPGGAGNAGKVVTVDAGGTAYELDTPAAGGGPAPGLPLLNSARRQHRRPFRLGPVATDLTSFATSTTADATLTKVYTPPISGLAVGQMRHMTDPERAAHPFDIGQGRPQIYRTGTSAAYVTPSPGTLDIEGQDHWPWIQQVTYRFMFDGDKMDVLLYAHLGSVAGQSYMVFVDDVPASLTPTRLNVTATYLHLIFPSAKPRKIEIRTDCLLNSINCGPLYRTWRPTPLQGPRLFVLGASYTQPIVYDDTTTALTNYQYGMWQQLEDYLDVEDVWIDGIGGTGFIRRPGTGVFQPNNNYSDRIPGVVATAPDMLFVSNAYSNDAYAGNAAATIAAAIDAAMTTVRTALPDCKIVLMTGIRAPVYGDFSATFDAVTADLQALRSDLHYVDTKAWLDAAGGYAPSHTNGLGNTDYYIGNDGIHPTIRGHGYFRARMAPILQRILNDDAGDLVDTVLTN